MKSVIINLIASLMVIFLPLILMSETPSTSPENLSQTPSYPKWQKVYKGFEFTRLSVKPSNSFLKSDLFLLKIKLENFDLAAIHAPTTLGKKKSSIDKFVKAKNAIAGINANFFDKSERPLGILISQTERLSSMHEGGKLLTGIFQIRNNIPSIINRKEFQPEMVELAIQAGPILISNNKPQKIISQDNKSRRSGIAITKSGDLLIFATELRFPGASFNEIQNTLISSGLEITDALNLDGGGSSQLFFYANKNKTKEIFVSGGDEVPAALVILKK